jgi:hypothetical protein
LRGAWACVLNDDKVVLHCCGKLSYTTDSEGNSLAQPFHRALKRTVDFIAKSQICTEILRTQDFNFFVPAWLRSCLRH